MENKRKVGRKPVDESVKAQRVNIALYPNVREKLEKLADVNKVSNSNMISMLIMNEYERYEKEIEKEKRKKELEKIRKKKAREQKKKNNEKKPQDTLKGQLTTADINI